MDWSASGCGSISNSSPVRYVCPLRAGQGKIVATIGGASHRASVRVVEPAGVECVRFGYLGADRMTGIGMALELHVLPYSVSFEGLLMKEVAAPANATSPEWGIHSGYFDDSSYQHRWYHYSSWGAGVWRTVGTENQWGGYDSSRMFTWPTPWSEGTMTWVIPIAWKSGRKAGDAEDGRFSVSYSSEWAMGGGVIVKTKYGQSLMLMEDGKAFMNDEQVGGDDVSE